MKFCTQNDNKNVYINFKNLHLNFVLFTTIPKMYINIMVLLVVDSSTNSGADVKNDLDIPQGHCCISR